MELTQSSTMSDIYDEATTDSNFLSDRNSWLWSSGPHSTSSILSCFESDSSISDQSDAS